ncbi:MAG: azurin [Verrucomicrobiales bacterium]|jgi:azurin
MKQITFSDTPTTKACLSTLVLVAACLTTALADDAEAEATDRIPPPQEQLENFSLAAGYEVNLYASEVDSPLHNPMGMAFDEQGRLWVITSPTYPHLAPGKDPQDKLLYFEDTDKDGAADKHTVFLDDLLIPTGFALDTDGVYLAQQPNIWFVKDTDGDGKADSKEVVLQGFSVEDSHHSTSAFSWGPDGSFYFCEGVFLHTQVETPYGPQRSRDAGVHRYKPSTQRFNVMSHHAYSNPWGIAFDRWGQAVISDASSGNHYNFAAVISAFDYPEKIVAADSMLKRGRPMAGNVIVSSGHFPDDVQGTHLNNQSLGFQGTRWDRFIAEGSGWRTEALPDLIQSTDVSFRPVASAIGPDGALYILDFCNPRIGHMYFTRDEPERDYSHGRIWRITANDRPLLEMPVIRGESPERLLELLSAHENHVRHWARRFLQNGPADDVMPALDKWIAALDKTAPGYAHLLTEALWVHEGRNVVNKELLKVVLALDEPMARAAAVRVIRHWLVAGHISDDEGIKLLGNHIVDVDMRVRLEAVTASGFLKAPEASELAVYASTLPMDSNLKSALRQTLKALEKHGAPTSDLGRSFSLKILPLEELLKLPMDAMVAEAILRRSDSSIEEKEKAIAAAMKEKSVSRARILVDTIGNLKADENGAVATLRQLVLKSDSADLQAHLLQLTQFASSAPTDDIRRLILATLTVAEGNLMAAVTSGQSQLDLYHSLLLVEDEKTLQACYRPIKQATLSYLDDATRRAAYLALAHIPFQRNATLKLLSKNILDARHQSARRFAAIEALNLIPQEEWPEALKPFELRSIRIKAVQSSLLFDKKEISVKAGQPLIITFENPDSLDHNLVIGTPDSLQEIGAAATQMITLPDELGLKKNYIPDLPSVIAGTAVIGSGKSEILTLMAPETPGDYVFVCTYPGHFGTMNGILKVAE